MSEGKTWKEIKEEINKLIDDSSVVDYIDICSRYKSYIHSDNEQGVGICSK